MNTPTKRIFYLFGPEIVKNEPQTMVWGSLTCKLQLCSWLRTNFAADYAGCVPTSQPITLIARQLRRRLRWLRGRSALVSRPVGAGCALAATCLGTQAASTALLDAGLLLGALDSSHLLLGKPNGTVIFSVVRSGTTMIAQVGTSCFQRRHVV